MALNWSDQRSYRILKRFKRSLTDEVERCRLAWIRSTHASVETRERLAWDVDETKATLEAFLNSPQGLQLDEWEEHHGRDTEGTMD